jgi:hypothetical protein
MIWLERKLEGNLVNNAISSATPVAADGVTLLYLGNITISNIDLDFMNRNTTISLAPNKSITVSLKATTRDNLLNTARVTATPKTAAGIVITGKVDAEDSDTSEVTRLDRGASVTIENTVFLGPNKGQSCGTIAATESVGCYSRTDVTFCFKIKNTGTTYLNKIIIDDKDVNFYNSSLLAPGASA